MMDPVSSVLLAWLLFAGTHIGMALPAVREPLVARLGQIGFSATYSLVAAVSFTALCYVYSLVSSEGPAGLALGSVAWVRWPLMLLSIFGLVCTFGSILDYPTSAYAASQPGRKPEPHGFERITRHGLAVGMSMVGASHALLATRLSGTVFFAALALFGVLGSVHQDAKLRRRSPELHGPYLAKSSLFPFVAILAGRNRLVLSELRPLAVVLGLLAAWGIREAHPNTLSHGGLFVAAAVIAVAVISGARDSWAMRKRTRQRRRTGAAAAPAAWQNGAFYQSLAACGATLITFIGICHEVAGHLVFPWGPAFLGGPIGWHATGLTAVVVGLLVLAGTLRLITFPVVTFSIVTSATGFVLVALTAIVHGQFHMFALAGALAGIVTAYCHPRAVDDRSNEDFGAAPLPRAGA